ncbi:hypothetical protein [Corynebacterium tuberculostearicum]|uniref:hypothetical protein n=1 Tax=Corynebacterium tuberculostearicum TaxID=38304 RepID=UPI00265CE6D9|nr:hypothetical protein [Corynebacterium tuberculostearicum]WKE54951.1 hypothetical protein J8245_10065 [Corynebacterium tuberculostearicum]
MHNSSPITFIAWDRANVAAVREVLAGLQRDGIFLRRGHLLLETSWLGTGARDFYATAWRWDEEDYPLFYDLARRGKLLLTISDTVISCGSKDDIADARDGIAQELIAAQNPQQLSGLLADAAED